MKLELKDKIPTILVPIRYKWTNIMIYVKIMVLAHWILSIFLSSSSIYINFAHKNVDTAIFWVFVQVCSVFSPNMGRKQWKLIRKSLAQNRSGKELNFATNNCLWQAVNWFTSRELSESWTMLTTYLCNSHAMNGVHGQPMNCDKRVFLLQKIS